ncbi:MAG TPA: YdcF family protein [Chitinophagaceae bacterium]|nr:YdcF family protein [Chitinophagaceae bacterium]
MLQKTKLLLIYKWVKRISGFLLIWIMIHIIYITIDGLRDYDGKADVAIILGNLVYADGNLSAWLQGRVDKAIVLYKEGRVKKIFASGGIGTKEVAYRAEGDAMKNYLVAHGVPAADIVADNYGQNTFLTAKNFIAWNKNYHFSSVIVVSSFYHITRSKYILRKLGFKNVYNAASDYYSFKDVVGTLREIPAFYKYMLVY